MSPIDWNTELAQIEREFNRQSTGTRTSPGQNPTRPSQAGQPARTGYPALAVWARLVLVAALAGSLAFWPYPRECGTGLYAFMGAGGMVVLGGIWVCSSTWRNRRGFAHTLAIVLLLGGLGAVGHQVLQRIGYTRINPSNPPTWQCEVAQTSR